jgi:Aromatic prenyltransferase Orf2
LNPFSLEQLATDIVGSAALVGAPADPALVRRVLDAFRLGFSESAVEFRTTSRAEGERELSYRYVALGESHFPGRPNPRGLDPSCVDPWLIARAQGLLVERGHVIERLLPALTSRFRVGGWGVDAGAAYGVEKLWPFLAAAYPIERALRVAELPAAVAAHREYYARHALSHFSILALDYRHHTVNLYFMVRPGSLRVDQLGAMIADLGMSLPERAVLEYNTGCVAINLTFSYTSPTVERLCFYVPALDANAVPTREHPIFARVVEEFPVAASQRMFVVGHTFARRSTYVKLEVDYSGTTLGCLAACAGVPIES